MNSIKKHYDENFQLRNRYMKNEIKTMVSQLNLNMLIQSLPGSVYWKDKNGVYLGCNEYLAKMVGLTSPKDIVGKTDHDFAKKLGWTNKIVDTITIIDKKVIESGIAQLNIEEPPFHIADGEIINQLTHKVPLRNEDGEVIGVLGISFDITHLKKLEQQLKIDKEKAAQQAKYAFLNLEQIVACMPGIVFWKDINGVYLGCNDNLLAGIGLTSRDQIIGKTDYDLAKILNWPLEVVEAFQRIDMQVVESGISRLNVEEPPFHFADGRTFYQLANKMPLCDENGKVVGVVGIGIDITELKETQKALAEQIKKTEQANRSSGKFIAQAAHEIRNPISSVISFVDEIKEHYENLYQNFIKIVKPMLVKANLEDLVKEIDDSYNELKICQEYAAGAAQGTDKALRNLEKLHFLQLTGVKTNWELNRVADLVNEAIKECNRVNVKQVKIKVEYSNELPEEIVLDFNNLRDALTIVIGNAIRFSPPNEIVNVCINKVKIDTSNYIDFIIQDFGVGIAQEQLDELYKANNQEDISVVEILKKPSVQLKRVKLIVEASDGNLIINNSSKKGTIVTIRIPYEVTSENIESKDTNEIITNKNDKTDECRILIVEDDKFIQKNHLRHLTALGYKHVDIASNGFEAVNAALEKDFDVVLLDLTLPEINGLEVMKKIIANKGDKTIFIVITSHTSEDTESYCLNQGAMAVLTKPVSKDDLKQYIKAALEIRWQIDSEE